MKNARKQINILWHNLITIFLTILLVSCSSTSNDSQIPTVKYPKNIIFMIGDGMGLAQIHAAMTVNHGNLNLLRCKYIGLSKTNSATNYITESGAGATAFSIGEKTYNRAIGVNKDSISVPNITEILSGKGFRTGVISTSAITHATPAAFVAHQKSRNSYEAIAADFLKSPIDLFIGGGSANFNQRSDSLNLVDELVNKGFDIKYSLADVKIDAEKIGIFTASEHNPKISEGRGDMLPNALETALNYFTNKAKPFFVMVEGSQIDWGGHDNDIDYITSELIDFDKAIGIALDFADKNKETLVVITADHETGGLSILGGSFEDGTVEAAFTTKEHSGIMVPVFAYGPGAELFIGIYENNTIFNKFQEALKVKTVD